MTKQLTLLSILVLAASAGACGKKDAGSSAKDQPAAKPTDDPSAAVAAKPADKPAAPPTSVAPPPAAPSGPSADESKEFLGLVLPPMGKWKPTWDADAKVAKWENDDYMTGIVIRIVKDKLDTIDNLKEAAPMMMQLGTAIVKVEDTKTTDKGWYAVVDDDEGGKNVEMTYVRKFGDSQIVCSGNLTPRKDPTGAGGIKKKRSSRRASR